MRKGTIQYLVKWKGYLDMHNGWIPAANCDNAKNAVADFHKKFPQKPCPRPSTQQLFIPLDDFLKKFLCPVSKPLTELVDNSLPIEAQLRRLYFRSCWGQHVLGERWCYKLHHILLFSQCWFLFFFYFFIVTLYTACLVYCYKFCVSISPVVYTDLIPLSFVSLFA